MILRVPVTVIGGYLGAGKTTLVNHLLRNAGGLRIAVLVNDFGDLPIDADLIEAQDDDLISIAGGCVCCSFGSDLMGALMAIAVRDPAPDHILIEASGVALPGSIASAVALLEAFCVDGVVVLADAETVTARSADQYMGDTILRQLGAADLVIANKADLAGPEKMTRLRAWIANAAPSARLVEAERGRVPIEVVLGLSRALATSDANALLSGPIRNIAEASDRYETATFTVEDPVDVKRLAHVLADPLSGLLRSKGIVRDPEGALQVFQVVANRIEIAPFAGNCATRIACIALRGRMDRPRIERAIAGELLPTFG